MKQAGASSATGRRERAVPAGVLRAVFARDGEQCTFVGDSGDRCPQRGHLELDHVEAWALGGTNAASNLRVRCRAHNRLAAEDVFGKAHVAERIDFRQRKSRAAAAMLRVPSPPPLRSLPSPPPPAQAVELALRGLRNMGVGASEARRAVEHAAQRHGTKGGVLDVQSLLRGAIAALT